MIISPLFLNMLDMVLVYNNWVSCLNEDPSDSLVLCKADSAAKSDWGLYAEGLIEAKFKVVIIIQFQSFKSYILSKLLDSCLLIWKRLKVLS